MRILVFFLAVESGMAALRAAATSTAARYTDRMCRALLIGLALLAAACGRTAGPPTAAASRLVERAGLTMGSELRLTAWTDDEPAAAAAFDAAFKEFDRLDRLMSVWKSDSDIVRLNAAAGRHAVHVSPEVLQTLHAARQVSD